MNYAWLAVNDCRMHSFFFGDFCVTIKKHFAAVCLAVHIDEEDLLAFMGKAGCQGNTCAGFSSPSFLGGHTVNHRSSPYLKPNWGILVSFSTGIVNDYREVCQYYLCGWQSHKTYFAETCRLKWVIHRVGL